VRIKLNHYDFLIIFFFSVLLFQHSWVEGFFHDGYLYAELGKNAAGGLWLVPHLNNAVYSEFFHHLPFVFILEGLFFKLFGASFVTARIFAGIFSLLTLIVLIDWVKKEKGDKLAWLTGIMLTITLPLIKKSRFPNLDLPLMLFVLLSLKYYFKKAWYLCGIFFGLSLLTKGPIGLFIPLIILSHLIMTKKISILKTIKPWLGLGLGFLIFGIWPLSLWFSGKIYIFHNWFSFTFMHTLTDSRGVQTSFFTYFIFLLKNCGPLFVGAVYSFWLYRKEKITCDFYILMSILFFNFLLLLSIPEFKYSHYLMPLYPSLAFLAAYSLKNINEKVEIKIKNFYQGLVILVTLVLLIFPVTTKTKRDKEIYKLKNIFEQTQIAPKVWKIIDGVYPFWSLNNLTSWHDLGLVQQVKLDKFTVNLDHEVILISENNWLKIKPQYQDRLFPLYKFSKMNMIVLITPDMMNKDYLYKE
jgi:4-amino-4-deoxy-L-arabinose transferase-like glycosyltransferase